MGLFDSIKKNLGHGGVRLKVDAPAKISWDDPHFEAVITITAKQQQKINGIIIELIKITQSTDGQVGGQQSVMIRSKIDESFVLTAGEQKVITHSIPVDLTKELPSGVDPESAGAEIAAIASKFGNVAEALDSRKYNYFVVARADVEDVSLDPSDRCEVYFYKPGQSGSAFRLGK
jgi:hypothetical protein